MQLQLPRTTPVTLSPTSTSTPKGQFACGLFLVHLCMSECQFNGQAVNVVNLTYVVLFILFTLRYDFFALY